jgi:DNA-binding response OmpR family regulator
MRLLIAEDDLFFQKLLQQILSPDHEIVVAYDGNEAWEKLQSPDAPQLAILDWVMPGLSGPQVCRRVRACATTSSMYLIILTAKNNEADIVSGLRAGADDYITKPPIPAELRARVGVGERILALQDAVEAQSLLANQASRRDNLLGKSPAGFPDQSRQSGQQHLRAIELCLSQHCNPEDCCSISNPDSNRLMPHLVAESGEKYHPHH